MDLDNKNILRLGCRSSGRTIEDSSNGESQLAKNFDGIGLQEVCANCPQLVPFPLAFPTLTKFRGVHDRSYEYALHKRDVQLGADGSVVRGGDWVYVLALIIPLDERIKQIDYFHGWNIAQMNDEYESDIPQRVMIPLYYHTTPGILTRRIIAIQRLWRKTWAIKHQIRIIKLAEFFRDLYARARREGIVIPSLDYEQKLASRRYGGVWKYQRALVREHKYRLRPRLC